MNRELKRRIYALALSGIIFIIPKMKAYAEEVDTTIDVEKAISELVPNYTESNNNQNNCYHLYEENPDKIINFINPTCTENGSYDEVYYCVKCGETRVMPKIIESLGHNWSNASIENINENGYDIINRCQNNGCNAEVIEHVNCVAPTEQVNNNIDQNQNDNIIEYNDSNSNIKVALTSLGIAGTSMYAAHKIKKLNKIKIKKIDKIKLNKPYKGKYLGKK